MKNRINKFKYSDTVLKNGYEAMAKINLGYAESALTGDTQDLMTYEEVLKNNISMGDVLDD